MNNYGNSMHNQPGSVTLIFRELERPLRKEHPMNILAAWATRSKFSHVEIAIGDACGKDGQMRNVLRVFNDEIGVELVERTGRNPVYRYVQLGCSKASELKMLAFARRHVGEPFNMWAMVRSVIWPRKTIGTSWYCAELSAACLQAGGLFPVNRNPGACTPESLWKQYIPQAATTGNPCTLRAVRYDQSNPEELQPLLRPRQRIEHNPALNVHSVACKPVAANTTSSLKSVGVHTSIYSGSSPSLANPHGFTLNIGSVTHKPNGRPFVPTYNRAEQRLRQAVQVQSRNAQTNQDRNQNTRVPVTLELQPFSLLRPSR